MPRHLDGGVRCVIEACLAKDPGERPPGAPALAARLREVQSAYLERCGMIDRDALS
jgi:hypothetical protein